MVKSRSVTRNAKNARGLGRDRALPFPTRARLIFALLVLIRPHYTIWQPGTGYSSSHFGIGHCKTRTADYCFHLPNENLTTIVPLFSNPKNNSPQSVHGLHFTLPLLESEYFTFPFCTKNGLYNSGSEKQKIKLQKTLGNLLDKLRKLCIIMERSSLEIFSHPHRKF